MPKVDLTRSDLEVSPNVRREDAIHKRSLPFLDGTGTLRVHRWREWWWTPVVFGGIAALGVFLFSAIEIWEFSWARNYVGFMTTLLSLCVIPILPFATIFSFRRRNASRLPTHVITGLATKVGGKGGSRSTTVIFQSPQGSPTGAKVITFKSQVKKGQRVVVLYYGDILVDLL